MNNHKNYDYWSSEWKKVRDCISGDMAIKRGRYVPALTTLGVDSVQAEQQYQDYINRSNFFNATQRTLDVLTGLVFSKNPTFTGLENIKTESMTLSNKSLRDFTEDVMKEVLTVGRVGVLADITTGDIENRVSGKPYLTLYTTESIINWFYDGTIVKKIVLREKAEIEREEFYIEEEIRYRVLDLIDGKYRIRVLGESLELLEEIYPLVKGKNIDYIPFVTIGVDNIEIEPTKPPLLDLALTNITHFKADVDYKNILHKLSIPILYTKGLENTGDLVIGGTSLVNLPDDGDIGYAEISGSSLSNAQTDLLELKRDMAYLGTNMLIDSKNVGESAEAIKLKQIGERAVLSSVAKTVQDGLKKIITVFLKFSLMEKTDEVSVKFNTEFLNTEFSKDDISAYTQMFQNGIIRKDEFVKKLVETEKIDIGDLSIADYVELLQDNGTL